MPIVQTQDEMLIELKRIVTTQLAMPVTFIYANMFEVNWGLDEITGSTEVTFPVFIYFTDGKEKVEASEAEALLSERRVLGMFLDQVDTPTHLYKSEEVDQTIHQMRQLAYNLRYWVNKSTLSVYGGMDNGAIEAVKGVFDKNLFGVGIDFVWRMNLSTNGYLNRAY